MIGRAFHLFLMTGLIMAGIGLFIIFVVLPILWLGKKVLKV